jgi:hypothetical protein
MYQVLKPIPKEGEILPSGSVVDASGWRNLKTLIAGRYLKPIETEPAVEDAKPKAVAKKPKRVAVSDTVTDAEPF